MLKKLSIGVKISVGFVLILGLLAAIGAIGVSGLKQTSDNFQSYRELSSETEDLANLRIAMLNAQIDAMRFVTADQQEARDSFRKMMENTLSDIQIRQENSNNPEQKARFASLSEGISRYQSDFESIVTKQAEVDTLVAEILDKAGENLDYQLNDIIDTSYFDENVESLYYGTQMLRNILLAELWANRYLVDLDSKALGQSFAYLDAYDANIGLLKEVMVDVSGKMAIQLAENSYKEYRAALEQVKILAEERAAMVIESQNATGPRIGKLAAEFQQVNSDQQNILGINIARDADQRVMLTVIMAIIGFIIGLVAALLVGRDISGSVRRMTGAMRGLADGNLEVEIPAQTRKDELGSMAVAVQIFKENALRVERLRKEREEAAKQSEAEKKEAMTALAGELDRNVGQVLEVVSETVTELKSAAEAMQQAADNSSRLSNEVTSAANDSSQNVKAVAAAAEQLSASISVMAGQVGETSSLSTGAVDEAGKATKLVKELEKAGQDISQVAEIITDIAEQTNLLALNATIEAARAGDAGKGFAVVANEVKTLANQTANATGEISSSIGLIQSVSQNVVQAITRISERIDTISNVSDSAATGVEEQRAATQEISMNIQRASAGSQDVSQNVEGVATAADGTGRAATQVMGASQKLSEQSENLRRVVNQFLAQLRHG